ncbi:6263_t:CDS:1, partial [Funneliformis mosseae]
DSGKSSKSLPLNSLNTNFMNFISNHCAFLYQTTDFQLSDILYLIANDVNR